MDSENEQILQKCRDMMASGVDIEYILLFLRYSGLSKIETIIVLRNVQKMSLKAAKETVHLSKTWSDVYQRDTEIHDMLEDIFREMGRKCKEE